jgi:hypothetical protein
VADQNAHAVQALHEQQLTIGVLIALARELCNVIRHRVSGGADLVGPASRALDALAQVES